MRSRGMSWLGPSCPPIIILTGFNLNNAACGFHRHARARLIISRTNSPTRYPSMVYHPTSYHYIFPSRLLLLLTRASPWPPKISASVFFTLLSHCSPASSRGLGRYDPWIYLIAFICTLTLLQLALLSLQLVRKCFIMLYVNEELKILLLLLHT